MRWPWQGKRLEVENERLRQGLQAAGEMAGRLAQLEGDVRQRDALIEEMQARLRAKMVREEALQRELARARAMLAIEQQISGADHMREARVGLQEMAAKLRDAQVGQEMFRLRAEAGERRVVELEEALRRRWRGREARAGRVPVGERDSRAVSAQLRWDVIQRDEGHCRYCGKEVGHAGQIDHVWPHSMGGLTVMENLVLACERCNAAKRDRLGVWPRPLAESGALALNASMPAALF